MNLVEKVAGAIADADDISLEWPFDNMARAAIAVVVEECAKVLDARHMGDNNREDAEVLRCAAAHARHSAPPYVFRRFKGGNEMAEGVIIENAETMEHAIAKAARFYPGTGTVFVIEDVDARAELQKTRADLAAANERVEDLKRDNANFLSRLVRTEEQRDAARADLKAAIKERDEAREARETAEQAGFDRAKFIINSIRASATWGPKATPDDGLKLGLEMVHDALLTREERIAKYGHPVCPDSETTPVDVRDYVRALAQPQDGEG